MNNRKLWLIAFIICLVSFSFYFPAIDSDFVNWDDPNYVYDNPKMKAPDADFLLWAIGTTRTGYWHPLTWLSLSIDYSFWELNPMGYHLTSVLLHALNTLLVVLLSGLLFMKGWPSQKNSVIFGASVVGVIFGLHPLHVESVAWISERKDVLYSFFWLLSLLAYTGYTSSAISKRRILLYLISFFSFALSITSKPMAVTFPVVLLILDFYPFKRLDQMRSFIKLALWEKLPFFLLSFIVSFMTIIAQKKEGAMGAMKYLSSGERLSGAVHSLGSYMAKTVLPLNLIPFYPLDLNISLFTWENMLSLIFVLSVTAVSLMLWKRIPLLLAAWSYYLITLLPVLGIIQVGTQAAADRYMYISIGGPLMIIGAVGAMAWEKGKHLRSLFIVLFFFYSLFISVATVKQIGVWQNSRTLWEHVISKEPEITLAHINLGLAYDKQGRSDDAIKEFLAAIQIYPDNAAAFNHLGVAYKKQGRNEDAIKAYVRAIEIDPDYARPHNNLGVIYFDQGLTDIAMNEFLTAIRIAPDQEETHRNLGVLYIETGRLKEAVREFQIASDLAPHNTELKENLEILKGMIK